MRHRHLLCAGLAAFVMAAPGAWAQPDEAPFLAENAAAMDRMMADMAVKPTGDVDMAVAYLRYGRNEQLRRIAQEIIVEQQQEIAAMRLALGQAPPPSAAAPTQQATPAAKSHHAMPMSPAKATQ